MANTPLKSLTFPGLTDTYTVAQPSSSTPADLGTAAAGSSDDYARADHVHNMPHVSINTSYISVTEPVVTLDPCPVTYDFGECDELTVTVTATTQYHFIFSCPSGTPTILTITGVTGIAGDTLAAGKTYEVDIWNGIALIMEVEATAP